MIISLSTTDENPSGPTRIFFCTALPFERMLSELDTIDMNALVDDGGVETTTKAEPFLLEHIYLN